MEINLLEVGGAKKKEKGVMHRNITQPQKRKLCHMQQHKQISEINQTKKDKYYMITLTRGIQKHQTLRKRKWKGW